MSKRPPVVTAAASLYALALALWLGGLVVLGAVVAPTVFRIVPAPTSADAMTVVFRRFDRIAMGCAAIALIAEALLAWRGGKPTWRDRLRALLVLGAGVLATVEGVWLSPAIEALHRGGAVRGLGEAGLALERLHRVAESVAKVELVLLVVVTLLLVIGLSRPRDAEARDA